MAADTGIGIALREAREQRGVAVEDVARTTKIRSDYLRALEAEEFDRIGGDVYAKGFLKTYATALGLDAEELLGIYRREVQGTPAGGDLGGSLAQAPVAREPRGAPPAWVVWGAAAVIVLVGVIVIAGVVGGGRTPEPAVQGRPPAAATPSPTPEPSTSTAEPTPTETAWDGVHVVLAFEQDSWVRVTVDGRVLLEDVVAAGETREFDGAEAVSVRYGNAGGVRVEVNGRDLGVVGERGRVEERTYDEQGEVQSA